MAEQVFNYTMGMTINQRPVIFTNVLKFLEYAY